jgi:hypothetical protein
VILGVAIYLVIAEGYTAVAFFLGLINARGSTRWRLGFASLGSALLGLTFAMIAIGAQRPSILDDTRTAIAFLPVFAGVSYYLAFAPPGWLRQTWQLPEVHKFFNTILGIPPAERSTASALKLCETSSAVGGGLASVVALWDDGRKRLTVQSSDVEDLVSQTLSTDQGALARADAQRLSIVAIDPADLGPDGLRLLSQAGASALLIVPIVTPRRSYGFLLVLCRRSPLFPNDDLALLRPPGRPVRRRPG